ncbi:MAG: dockerin type I repeat-containing protein [Ruminococcus sp.]|nr:dockerin type I repeat-containing protein [Ruminococcus sp.]
MKNIKKMLAVVLSMMMLLSSLPMVSVGALDLFNTALELDTPTEVSIDGDTQDYTFRPEKDGWYKFYSIGEKYNPYITIYNVIGTEIASADDNDEDYNFTLVTELKKGFVYYVSFGIWDEEAGSFEVCVEEAVGVESVKITQEPYDMTVIEGFEGETYDPSGLEAVFTLSDGSTADWSYDEDNKVGDFIVDVSLESEDDTDFYLVIRCANAYDSLLLTTVENPVESLEYNSDTMLECYENTGGEFDYEGNYIYFYDIPEDAVITVNFKDGTSVDALLDEEIEGISFQTYDDQYENPWGVGENYFTIAYLGVEVKVNVTILACPFKNVTVESAPVKEYIYGDYSTGFLFEDGLYSFWTVDLTGLSFTVEYEDGTTQTFTDDDIDMDMQEIDGYSYEVFETQTTEPGTVEAYIEYRGAQIKFDVNVIETHIESIEVLSPPDKAECYTDYYADFTGAVIKLNYKDGTSAEATANEDTMSYYHDGMLICEIQVGDDVVIIFHEDGAEDYIHDYLSCAGVGLVYEGVTYTESPEVLSITAENVTMSGEDMVLNVEYSDGSTETLTLNPIAYYEESEYYTDAYALTENGILGFTIEKMTDDEGEVVGYTICALGLDCFVEAQQDAEFILGDVNGDGEVTVVDATIVQRYVAKSSELDDNAFACADVNGDGDVSVVDATVIQRHVAKIEAIL